MDHWKADSEYLIAEHLIAASAITIIVSCENDIKAKSNRWENILYFWFRIWLCRPLNGR